MVAVTLRHEIGNISQGGPGRCHFDSWIANVFLQPITEDRRDANAEAADFNDTKPRGKIRVEAKQPHIGAEKGSRFVADRGHRSNEFLSW
jgi:hypothetical protein